MHTTFFVARTAAVCLAAFVSMPALAADRLNSLLACDFGPQLQAQSVSRWPGGAGSREVATTGGKRRVSVADGYRVLLGVPGKPPGVNLKLERSQDGRLGEDRLAILAQMSSFSFSPGVNPFSTFERHGIEVMAVTQGMQGAMYTLIAEADQVVATAYVLNGPGNDATAAERAAFEARRDKFVDTLAACMAGT